jgi:hypothetical protein
VIVPDDDIEVLDCRLLELALLWMEEEAMFSEPPEHLPDDFAVMGKVRVRNEDAIQVDHDISRQNEVLEDVVHHRLEGGRRSTSPRGSKSP